MTALLVQLLVIGIEAGAGALWWAMIRRGQVSVLELLGVGLAVGTVAATLSDMAWRAATGWGFGWAIPALVVIALAAVRGRRHAWASVRTSRPEWLGFAASMAAGSALLLVNWRRFPLPTDAVPSNVHPDLLFFEALSRGLVSYGPGDSVLMVGTPVRYHWLSYAWSGSIDAISSAPAFQVLTQTLPVVALIAASAVAVSWARRMSTVPWVPTLAGLLVVLSGFVGAQYGVLLNVDSPSQQFSLVWSLTLAMCLFAYVRDEIGPWALAVLALLAVATTGGKINAGLICVLGAAALAAAALIRREPWARRATVAAVVIGALSLATYVLMIRGVDISSNIAVGRLAEKASAFQGLDPFPGAFGTYAGTAILALATLPRLAGLAPLVWLREYRWRPETVFAVSTVAAGLAVLFVLSEGINDLWFILAASGPGSVIAAMGVGVVAGEKLPTRAGRDARVVSAIASGIVVVLLVALSRTAEPHIGVRVWGLPILALLSAGVIGIVVTSRLAGTSTRRTSAVAVTVVSLTTMGLLGRAFILSDGTGGAATPPSSDVGGTGALPTPTPTPPPSPPAENPPTPVQTRPGDVWDAAEWVTATVPPAGVIVTNRPESLEVPALSGLRTYLSGNRYQVGLGDAASAAEVPVRAALSWGVAAGPGEGRLDALCAEGVSWLWIEGGDDISAWEGTASVAYRNPSVVILQLESGACAAR